MRGSDDIQTSQGKGEREKETPIFRRTSNNNSCLYWFLLCVRTSYLSFSHLLYNRCHSYLIPDTIIPHFIKYCVSKKPLKDSHFRNSHFLLMYTIHCPTQ
ncbi:hypothetical protein KSP39_PZI021975 [Platanthera zijinensis]|uniref:Uncharacterized protein n=1 Tax=Platanthera zijinensis TaxID=2320716 RepID=A0AAP0AYU5_9ASPA